MAHALLPVQGVNQKELTTFAAYSSLHDETPEGRSVVEFAKRSGLLKKNWKKVTRKALTLRQKRG